MTRTVPEWIGKTPDAKIPPRVQTRVFLAHEGKCHITGRKIQPGEKWDMDHVIALCNGGENRESNLAPALQQAHRQKTSQDVAQKKKDARVRAKHLGIHKPKSTMPGSRASKWKRPINGPTIRREAQS